MLAFFLLTGRVQAEKRPTIRVTDAQGETFHGSHIELDFKMIRLSQKEDREWETSDVLRIDFDHPDVPKPYKKNKIIFLQNGDRLIVQTFQLEKEEQLKVSWNILPKERRIFYIPSETIKGLLFTASDEKNDNNFLKFLRNRQIKSDLLLLKNGDTLKGELDSLDSSSVALKNRAEKTTIAHQKAVALLMNPEWASFPKVPKQRWILSLIDGSRLTVINCEMKSLTELKFSLAYGGELIIPLKAIFSIDLLGGKAVYLSRIPVSKFQYQPFFSSFQQIKSLTNFKLSKQFGINKNVKQRKLQLRGKTYRYGIGMRSYSSVTWNLNKKYQSFRAVAGIDDTVAGKGDVLFVVQLDGKPVFTSGHISGKSKLLKIPAIDVSQSNQITLIVEYGARGDICDHANWCDTILVKKDKK